MTPEELSEIATSAYRHMTPWSEAQFASSLADPATILIPQSDAFLLARITLDEAEILAVATDPKAQRRGRASALLDALHQEAKSRGVRQIFLEVSIDNVPARALYEAWDYKVTGRRKDYYRRSDGTRADALIMSRQVP